MVSAFACISIGTNWSLKVGTQTKKDLLYAFFWVIPRRLNLNAGELPRRKHTTFRTWRMFEIKKIDLIYTMAKV
jgi:hypothetical protein